ncbi:hypothetical protein [Sphingobium sp. HWE2-09]|uniref:hypothetical protein n=1 Tax=Sphingobium sp. HWE2-09 TaxID=3108390 RepID=UPI00403E9E91
MPLGIIADGSGEMPQLEEVCSACAGKGEIPARRFGNTYQTGGPCNDCDARGTKVTQDGQRLLAFLRRHHP